MCCDRSRLVREICYSSSPLPALYLTSLSSFHSPMNASTEDWWELTVLEYPEEAAATSEVGERAAGTAQLPTFAGNATLDELLENLTWARDLGVPRVWLLTHATVAVPPELHLLVGFILTTIGVLGTAGNAIVVWVFTR